MKKGIQWRQHFLLMASVLFGVILSQNLKAQNIDSTANLKSQLYELTQQLKIISGTIASIKNQIPVDSILVDSIRINPNKKLIAEDTSWVVFQGDSLWPVFVSDGADTPGFRSKQTVNQLNKVSFFNVDQTFDSLTITTENQTLVVKSRGNKFFSITANDAIILNTTPEELANKYVGLLRQHSSTEALFINNKGVFLRIGKVALILLGLILLVKLLNLAFRKSNRFLVSLKGSKLQGLSIKSFEIINDEQVVKIALFVSRIIRLILVLFLISLSLPLIFSLFPWTESLTETLIGYVLDPVQEYFWLFVHYIPNLISIIIISYIGHFILKFIKYLANEVKIGNLVIPGFYTDWVAPTHNLMRFGLYIILLIFIFPFLPGSESPIFKGVSVFVGILITMGSSSSVNNVVAGLVLTYMRPFKQGDRIKVDTILGFVIEKTLLVTRLRTAKQEIITIPNAKILNTNIINYSTSIQENDGVVVHSKVTIGYEVPWRKVHKALLRATEGVDSIAQEPAPFVHQTALHDYFAEYEINAYVTNVKTIISTHSKLHQNIQDVFRDEGIEIMSPHYHSWRNGEESTIPKKVKEDYTFKAKQVDDHTPELDQQTKEEETQTKKSAAAKKTEAPKSFIELIDKVTKEEKKEESDTTNETSTDKP